MPPRAWKKLLICLTGLQAGVPSAEVASHLLDVIDIYLLVGAARDVLRDALNYLPTALPLRFGTPFQEGGHTLELAWVKVPLGAALRATQSLTHYTGGVHEFYTQLYVALDSCNLHRFAKWSKGPR